MLNSLDRFFWITLYRYWSRWKDVLVIVMPDTYRLAPRRVRPLLALAIQAHRGPATNHQRDPRTGSAPGGGNPDWGAPKIHGELLKLGFVVSERSVTQYQRE